MTPDFEIKGHTRHMPDGTEHEVKPYIKCIEGKERIITDNIRKAEEAMGFEADTRINLLTEPKSPPHGEGQKEYQRHVAIEWEGGVIWLNMFDFVNGYEESEEPHYCIDVRQFNSAGKVKGEGVFTMARGYRGMVGIEGGGENDDEMVKGRGWNGGYLVSILTDPDGKESHTDDEREK